MPIPACARPSPDEGCRVLDVCVLTFLIRGINESDSSLGFSVGFSVESRIPAYASTRFAIVYAGYGRIPDPWSYET